MNRHFYLDFAWNGISKNRKFYLPYLLACSCMIMMYYIPSSLMESCNGPIAQVGVMLGFGRGVVVVFSLLIIGYTNSFLFKRRTKEFGLYNILGLNKRNIAHILLWETVISFSISYVCGIILGIIFGKLGELVILNLINEEINFGVFISTKAIINAFEVYATEFIVLYVFNLFKLGATKPINLLHNDQMGEKPPKAKWLLGILGAVSLTAGYAIALIVKNPAAAISYFFLAVVLVIIGTYLLFICGSIVLCRILQKNKKFYYKTRHFISVSSMVYRMNRNGAGLASICILSTMVLVMVSMTAELYYGVEDMFSVQYPHSVIINGRYDHLDQIKDETSDEIEGIYLKALEENDVEVSYSFRYNYVQFFANFTNGEMKLFDDSVVLENVSINFDFKISVIGRRDYERISAAPVREGEGELLCFGNIENFKWNEIVLPNGKKCRPCCSVDESFWGKGGSKLYNELVVVVDDVPGFIRDLGVMEKEYGLVYGFTACIDTDDGENTSLAGTKIAEQIHALRERGLVSGIWMTVRADKKSSFVQDYGGIYFMGMMLSFVFLMATVLIIYYKQISEGYEDQNRFEIMQKVGMTKKDIKKSINTQMLIVFFLPLIAAGIHLAFAFPMLQKMLVLFNLTNKTLLVQVTLITYAIYSVFYIFVYKLTTNAYYSITVSDKKKE